MIDNFDLGYFVMVFMGISSCLLILLVIIYLIKSLFK